MVLRKCYLFTGDHARHLQCRLFRQSIVYRSPRGVAANLRYCSYESSTWSRKLHLTGRRRGHREPLVGHISWPVRSSRPHPSRQFSPPSGQSAFKPPLLLTALSQASSYSLAPTSSPDLPYYNTILTPLLLHMQKSRRQSALRLPPHSVG